MAARLIIFFFFSWHLLNKITPNATFFRKIVPKVSPKPSTTCSVHQSCVSLERLERFCDKANRTIKRLYNGILSIVVPKAKFRFWTRQAETCDKTYNLDMLHYGMPTWGNCAFAARGAVFSAFYSHRLAMKIKCSRVIWCCTWAHSSGLSCS